MFSLPVCPFFCTFRAVGVVDARPAASAAGEGSWKLPSEIFSKSRGVGGTLFIHMSDMLSRFLMSFEKTLSNASRAASVLPLAGCFPFTWPFNEFEAGESRRDLRTTAKACASFRRVAISWAIRSTLR